MDIEQHPEAKDKVLVTIANPVEEDKIRDAFFFRSLPNSLFAFEHTVIEPWFPPRERTFPYTELFPRVALGPIAIEAFSGAGTDSAEGRICDQMGQTVMNFIQGFRYSSPETTEQPQP